jgi:pyrroloquinoline quinone biosynthesis protein D
MQPPTDLDNAKPRLAPGVRLQIDCTTGRAVLMFPEGILELNETAQEILTRCDGRTVANIVGDLTNEYDMDAESLANDVRETLAELRSRRLVEFTT